MTGATKPRIAVLGLGLMGGSIARRFVETGWNPVLWNRTRAKAEECAAGGGTVVETAEQAWQAADFTFMVPISYDAAYEILGGKDAKPDFQGKVIIQLANGTADDTRAFGAWLAERNARYLDANIFCYPAGVGDETSMVVYCGPKDVFEAVRPVVGALSGSIVHASEDPAANNAVTIAQATFIYGALAAFFQACLLCEREGQDLGVLLAIIRGGQAETDGLFDGVVEVGRTRPPLTPATMASLTTHLNVLQSAVDSYMPQPIDTRFLQQTLAFFRRFDEAGYGGADIENAYMALKSGVTAGEAA